MLKVCSTCKEEKPLIAFYTNSGCSDGYLGQCKLCNLKNGKFRYLKKKKEILAYRQGWAERNREKRRQTCREYYARNVSKILAAQEKRRKAIPGLAKVYAAVRYAVLIGKLYRPTHCPKCNREEKIEAHHHMGYDDPLNVMWLCPVCHRRAHVFASTG